jgi:hypothetical protein
VRLTAKNSNTPVCAKYNTNLVKTEFVLCEIAPVSLARAKEQMRHVPVEVRFVPLEIKHHACSDDCVARKFTSAM